MNPQSTSASIETRRVRLDTELRFLRKSPVTTPGGYITMGQLLSVIGSPWATPNDFLTIPQIGEDERTELLRAVIEAKHIPPYMAHDIMWAIEHIPSREGVPAPMV